MHGIPIVIGVGANKLTEIVDKAHVLTASLAYILKSLQMLAEGKMDHSMVKLIGYI